MNKPSAQIGRSDRLVTGFEQSVQAGHMVEAAFKFGFIAEDDRTDQDVAEAEGTQAPNQAEEVVQVGHSTTSRHIFLTCQAPSEPCLAMPLVSCSGRAMFH